MIRLKSRSIIIAVACWIALIAGGWANKPVLCATCPDDDFNLGQPVYAWWWALPEIDIAPEETHTYELDLDASTQYTFTTCEGGSYVVGNVDFTLYDQSCNEVRRSNDHYLTGAHINFTPTSNGIYYLTVIDPECLFSSYSLAYSATPYCSNCPSYNLLMSEPSTAWATHARWL